MVSWGSNNNGLSVTVAVGKVSSGSVDGHEVARFSVLNLLGISAGVLWSHLIGKVIVESQELS